uniref:Putative protease (I) and scaffold (Z) protein n=1 Tax=viral metagenome TaxID=1070528 RepID=A0A6M3J3E6_9ZZZZ
MPATAERNSFRMMVPLRLAEGDLPADAEKPTAWIQVAREGEWIHDHYGTFSLTADDLANMVMRFTSGPRDVMVDYNHASFSYDPEHAKAAGWVKELEIRGTELWALVEWTPKAAQMIRDGEYRFISPELDYEVTSKESGEVLGTMLLAVGLVNRPFIEGMAPVELREGAAAELFVLSETVCRPKLSVPPTSGDLPAKQGAFKMNDDRIRELLKLAVDVAITDEHRTQAVVALETENTQLREAAAAAVAASEGQVLVPEAEHAELLQLREQTKGAVVLTADEARQLKEDAKAGREAKTTLELKEREELVDKAIRDRKVYPAERTDLLALAEGPGLAKVRKLIEARPVMEHLLNQEAGSGDGGIGLADREKVAKWIEDKAVTYRTDPHKLSEHQALQRAQTDARREFGEETYNAYKFGRAA